jgi:calreticulin
MRGLCFWRYRLVLKPDNTAKVEIDGEQIYEGSLKEDWELLAPKEIKDPVNPETKP